jgi:hypothetical protein
VDGRDLFDIVAGAKTPQQIASHSYSHTRFDYAGMTHAARLADLLKSRSALSNLGHNADALVFPENIVEDWPALAGAGLRIGRLPAPPVHPTGIRPLDRILAGTIACPPMVEEHSVDTIVRHSGSLFFNWYGKGVAARRYMVVQQAKKAIARAARTGATAHLWLHPFNLTDSVGMPEALAEICDFADRFRQKGQLSFARF